MPPELLNILIQIPFVAVFIWYSDRKDRLFQEFLREERAARAEQMHELAAEVRGVRDCLDSHDRKTDEAISTMRERTRPRSEVTKRRQAP